MAIQKLEIDTFIKLSKEELIIDVRSPSEFNHAHIPNACSLPLFTDQERKVIGTLYKQESKEKAIKYGLDYFGPKMRTLVEEVEERLSGLNKKVFVHCWRGGMRSGAVAWLLDLYGFEVYLLDGGYKAFRNWVLAQFEKPYNIKIIGGYTGSGKTYVLAHLEGQTLDLEHIASHKGSALGGFNQPPQTSQEMFENNLGLALSDINTKNPLFLEDESQRIGNLNIPHSLWNTMKESDLYFLDIPFEERLNFLVNEYGVLNHEDIKNAIIRIQKRLGGLETKNALAALADNNLKECFKVLLHYYDKFYKKGLESKPKVFEIKTNAVLPIENAKLLMSSFKLN